MLLLFHVPDAATAPPTVQSRFPSRRYFSMYNDYKREPGEMWKMKPVYHEIVGTFNPASSCIECKACERHCPQKLTITDYLKEVKNSFEA